MKKVILIGIVAMVSLGAGVLARSGWSIFESVKQPLPAFSLPDLSGKQHSVIEWQGKILVINFWATWCPPCKEEIPEFIALQELYADQNLQFLGVAIDDKESVDEYLSFININYPILIAADGGVALAHQLGNISDTVPFTIIVNADGQIIHRHQGEFSKEQIIEIIKPLLTHNKTS
jgi:thiol-disulfide isomerase/thioredoxin